MRRTLLLILAVTAVQALEIGAKAPSLDGVTWIKGTGPALATGTPVVVEFWATWCGPCRTSIPHLTALQDRYGDRLAIVGISNEDAATVEPFVADMGETMDYAVGVAAPATHQAYMEGVPGIPHAFIVDGTGTVVWKGHPMSMDSALDDAVHGRLNAQTAAARAAAEKALETALQEGDPDRIGSAVKSVLALDPGNTKALELGVRVADYKGEASFFHDLFATPATSELTPGAAIARIEAMIDFPQLAWRNLEKAVELAEHAKSGAPERADAQAIHARVRYLVGDLDGAIASQEAAIAAGDNDEAQAVLTYYRTAKALRDGQ